MNANQVPPLPLPTFIPAISTVRGLPCGLCGLAGVYLANSDRWSSYCRAVYCVGTDVSAPHLSGVGGFRAQDAEYCLPPEAHQQVADAELNPLSLIYAKHISPPGTDPPTHDNTPYWWGFLFHDACWSLLEQAVKPDAVDVDALWRILLSVPCSVDLPNWGHNYGGLYAGTARNRSRGEHFVLLGPNSNLRIPSTILPPFEVPELRQVLASCGAQPEDGGGGGPPRIRESAVVLNSIFAGEDPFSRLPLELRELLLCHLASEDVQRLRLASRELATTPLTQQFFRSRFWPGRELHAFFDGFLLGDREMHATDWARLYAKLQLRLDYNLAGLGERNRLRIWRQTVKPLAEALDLVARLSELQGGSGGPWELGETAEPDWRRVRTHRPASGESWTNPPENYGQAGRFKRKAEVLLPEEVLKGVHVSLFEFFGVEHVAGLRFVFEKGDDVEFGYILRGREKYLPVDGSLRGFHCAVDECGFRALALVTGQHMTSEYLDWAGDVGSLTQTSLSTPGLGLRTVRGCFDGFRLTSLSIPEAPNSKVPLGVAKDGTSQDS